VCVCVCVRAVCVCDLKTYCLTIRKKTYTIMLYQLHDTVNSIICTQLMFT